MLHSVATTLQCLHSRSTPRKASTRPRSPLMGDIPVGRRGPPSSLPHVSPPGGIPAVHNPLSPAPGSPIIRAVTVWLLLQLFLVSCPGRGTRMVGAESVFASLDQLKFIAAGERELLEAIDRYIASERKRLDAVERLIRPDKNETSLSEGEKVPHLPSSGPIQDPLSIAGDPLKVFQMIKRFTTTWVEIWELLSDFKAWEELMTVRTKFEPHLPTAEDLAGARLSLARLQSTYDLPLIELASGRINGKKSSPPLSQQTVMDVGYEQLNALVDEDHIEMVDGVIRWLNFSLTHKVEPLADLQAIYHGLAQAHALKEDYLTSVDFLRKAIELDPELAADYLTNILPPADKMPTKYEEAAWRRNYTRLCQQAAFGPHKADNRSSLLFCSYKSSRHVPYLRHKLEYLHVTPDVILVHDIVYDDEIRVLQELASAKLIVAMVGSLNQSVISTVRVGKIGWLYDEENKTVAAISNRIGDVTGLDITFPTSEPLQMSNYGIGGHYEPHFDHNDRRFEEGIAVDDIIIQNGDRIATFMLYLSDVELGGATAFPNINLYALPVKKAGIYWYNYKRSGEGDENSLHAGCPVILGEKWVANKWIHEFGQEFRRPCDLNPNI